MSAEYFPKNCIKPFVPFVLVVPVVLVVPFMPSVPLVGIFFHPLYFNVRITNLGFSLGRTSTYTPLAWPCGPSTSGILFLDPTGSLCPVGTHTL